MKKTILFLFIIINFANADYLFQPLNICIKDYYYKQSTGDYYIVRSDTGATVTDTTKNYGDDIFPDYEYNATTGLCSSSITTTLGLSTLDFNYLNALIGVFIAFLMVWSILL